jgi:hypothetical protein
MFGALFEVDGYQIHIKMRENARKMFQLSAQMYSLKVMITLLKSD